MANDDDEWTPDKPMADKADEEDCQREAQAQARVTFLRRQYEGEGGGGRAGKKRKRLFSS